MSSTAKLVFVFVMHSILLVPGLAAAAAESVRPAYPQPSTVPVDTIGCRTAAVSAVKTWFAAIGTADTAAVLKAVSPTFAGISAGRKDWPEPFFRATRTS